MSMFAVAAALFFGCSANAQDIPGDTYEQGFRLGFGLNAGYVFDDPYDFALGGDVRLQYDLSRKTSLTLTTGFTNFFAGKQDNIDFKDYGFIPVKAGFKAFVWEDSFYVLGEAGAGFGVTNREKSDTEPGYDDKTSFILSPGIGYANKYIDLSLRYEHYSDIPVYDGTPNGDSGTGQLALRVAYGFKL
jgi:hypothetical protein